MPDNIGSFEVRNAAGARVDFFPLMAGTTVAQATTPNPVAPGGAPNPIVAGNFGILDAVVGIPDGAPVNRAAVANTGLGQLIAGAAVNSATLFANGQLASVCFAIDTGGAAANFTGTLRVITNAAGTAMRLDIPIEVVPNAEQDDLFIAFALIANRRDYTWIRMRAINHQGGAAVAGAASRIRPVRDNNTVTRFNRICPAQTTPTGFLSHTDDRDVVGVPINWPIIFEFEAANFVRRAHMLEFAAAQRTGHHNNNAHTPADVHMTATANASLAARRFAFDPGHGVVYAALGHRRVQEWFLAHRIATGVRDILHHRHGVPLANMDFMRTAGLGMIDPADVDVGGAPETGDQRYEYDMGARTVRILNNALSLTHISNLLLATHAAAYPFAAQPVPVADRDQIIAANPATLAAIVARNVGNLPGRTLVPNTLRWNPATDRYVFDTVPTPPAAGPPPAPGPAQTHNVLINTGDRFAVTNPMLRNLAERTARWSLNREVAGDNAYRTAARNAMIAQGALAYMADAVFNEADHPAGHTFVSHGIKGWSFGTRRTQLRALPNTPNVTLTLHHNAVNVDGTVARGNVMLASNAASATAAHMRLQKTFVKYVKGLEQGLRQRGIINTHGSALNGALNAALIPGYAFFENEFMNASSPVAGLNFEYQRMVLPAFVDRTVEEIVAAIVEFLLNPQPNGTLDPPDVGAGLNTGGVRW